MEKLWLCLKLLLAPFLPEEAFFSAAPFTFSKISENKQKLVEFTDFYILHSWGPDKVDEMSNFETMINIYIFLKYQYLQ